MCDLDSCVVMRRLDLRGSTATTARDYRHVVPRAPLDVDHALDAVRPIIADVEQRGDAALLDLAERFDKVRPASVRVPLEVLDDSLSALDPSVRRALETSIERARLVHADQRRDDVTTTVVTTMLTNRTRTCVSHLST